MKALSENQANIELTKNTFFTKEQKNSLVCKKALKEYNLKMERASFFHKAKKFLIK